MRCHFISIWAALKKKKKSQFFQKSHNWSGRRSSFKKSRAEEEEENGGTAKRSRSGGEREKGAGERGQTSQTGQRGNAQQRNGVNVCLGKQRETTDKESRLSLFSTTDSSCSPCWRTEERGCKSFTRAAKFIRNSWSCICTNCCINAVNIFQRLKVCGSKMWPWHETQSCESSAVCRRRSATEPHWSRSTFSEKIQVRGASTQTLQGLRILAKWSQLWLHPTAV